MTLRRPGEDNLKVVDILRERLEEAIRLLGMVRMAMKEYPYTDKYFKGLEWRIDDFSKEVTQDAIREVF